jgi:transcriptional regulatory protein RtcR
MKRVAFGFIGTKLDLVGGYGAKRHTAWRPTVALARDEVLGLSRIELWHDAEHRNLARLIQGDVMVRGSRTEVVLREVSIRDPWSFEEVYAFLYDFTEKYNFDDEREEYFVHLTTGTHVAQICLFLLTESRHFPAKLVQTSPQSSRGPESVVIIDLDLSRYDSLAQRFERKLADELLLLKDGIGTRNAAFNRMIEEIGQVARSSQTPILLLGPTGAGKSHLARQVYLLKKAHHLVHGELVDVNCATLRGDHAMSTLFGHAKGAFTGANTRRNGLLKKADGGLLFLDEIGELGLDEQAMLLRAIEEQRFLPLGSDQEEESDFQLISGTNRDLSVLVREGRFREDLFYRINMWSFTIPSLSDRREDLEPNLAYELKKFESRVGKRITFSAEARRDYLAFAMSPVARWAGNFRDLNASVARMATLALQGRITPDVVASEIERLQSSWEAEPSNRTEQVLRQVGLDPADLDLFDQAQLVAVIQVVQTSSSLAEAGRKLFGVSRMKREKINDSDRLRKYLGGFGLQARDLIKKNTI